MHVISDHSVGLVDLARTCADSDAMVVNNTVNAQLDVGWGFRDRLIPDHFLCLVTQHRARLYHPDGTRLLEAGQVVICGPDIAHGMTADDGPLRLRALRFAPGRLLPGLWWVGAAYPAMEQDLARLPVRGPQVLIPAVDPMRLVLATTIAMVVARQALYASRTQAPPSPVLAALKARLDAAPAERWSVADMADAVGMSPSHFHRSFRVAYGSSPNAYLIRRRCEHAARLLDGGAGVAAVAAACDYADAFTFSRQFRQVMGLPPSRWQARI